MLVVVKRYKDNKVGILDTDDGIVEKIGFGHARNLKVHISGLTVNNTLNHQLYVLNGREYTFKYVMVYWAHPDDIIRYSGVRSMTYDDIEEKCLNTVLSRHPIGYIIASVLFMKFIKDAGFIFHYCGKEIMFDGYDAESYIILLLYVLRHRMFDRLKITNNGLDICYPFEEIISSSEIFEWGGCIYFCDSDCVLQINSGVLSSVENIMHNFAKKVKAKMLSNNDLSLLTNKVEVNACRTLTIDDDKVYSFRSMGAIKNLILRQNNATLNIESAVIVVTNFTASDCSKAQVIQVNDKLYYDALDSYTVTKDLVDYGFIVSFIDSRSVRSNFKYTVVDITTQDDADKFVIRLINKNHSSWDTDSEEVLKFINCTNFKDLISADVKSLLVQR